MAPPSTSKNTSSKVAAATKPTEPYAVGGGFHGFRSQEDMRWFETVFKTRRVVIERPLSLPARGDDLFYIQKLRQYEGLCKALSVSSEVNITMVREFYASLVPIDKYSSIVHVRGHEMLFDYSMAASAFGIPGSDDEDFECPFAKDAKLPTKNQVAKELTGKKFNWTSTYLRKEDLTLDYQMLHLVVCQCLLPTTNRASMNLDLARVVYAIGTGMTIDFPQLLYQTIIDIAGSKGKPLKLGVLITRFLAQFGVEAKASDEKRMPGKAVGESSAKRSKGQLKHKHTVQHNVGEGSRPSKRTRASSSNAASVGPSSDINTILAPILAEQKKLKAHCATLEKKISQLEKRSDRKKNPVSTMATESEEEESGTSDSEERPTETVAVEGSASDEEDGSDSEGGSDEAETSDDEDD